MCKQHAHNIVRNTASTGNRGSVHSVCRGGWDFADKGRFPCHLGRKNDLLCILHAEAATTATETEVEAKARGKEGGQDNIKIFIKVG